MHKVIAVLVVVLANLVFCSCSFAGTYELVKLVENREFWSSYYWGNFEESELYKSTNWRLSGGSGVGDTKITDNYDTHLQLGNLNVTHMSMYVGYPDKNVRWFSIYSPLNTNSEYYLKLVSWCDERYGNDHIERKYLSGQGKYQHEVLTSYWERGTTRIEVKFEKNFSNGENSVGFFTTLSFWPNYEQKTITVKNADNLVPGPVAQATIPAPENQTIAGPNNRRAPLIGTTGPAPSSMVSQRAVAVRSQSGELSPNEPGVSPKLGWKGSERYEINNFNGYQETYDMAEPIVFSVGGKSDRIDVDPATGFIVTATIYETPQRTVKSHVTGDYDPGREAWQVTIPAPSDNSETYALSVVLTCSIAGSQCTELYGVGSQVDKLLPLKLR